MVQFDEYDATGRTLIIFSMRLGLAIEENGLILLRYNSTVVRAEFSI